jgi:integrase
MASISSYISKGGTETFKVRYRIGGRSGSTTFPTLDEAERFGGMVDDWGAKRALEYISQPTELKRQASGDTVTRCVEKYIELRPSAATRAVYSVWLRVAITPTLGEFRINKLTREDVQRWVNAQTHSGATIVRNRRLLSSALKAAVERGEIQVNPATGVKVARTLPNPKRAPLSPPLTHDEYGLMVKATAPRWRLLVEFLGETGCRFGEAAALTPADIHLDAGTVHFHSTYSHLPVTGYELGVTKTKGSDRVIRVKQSLLERLDLTGEFVFSTVTGARVKDNSFRRFHWRRMLESSGLPEHRYAHPHDLRHAHATWLLDAGLSLPAIQKRLGHADVMTTLRLYGHAATDSEERILEALENLG